MAVITSNAIGSIWDGGAVVPAVHAAIRKVIAWPATTRADASTTPGRALRGSPSQTSPSAAPRTRTHADRAPAGFARATSTTASVAPRTAIATQGIDDCTGDGSARRTTTVRQA